MSTGRIVLVVTSPRLPAGLLTAAAWDLVRAHPVFVAARSPLSDAVQAAGVQVHLEPRISVDTLLAATATHGTVVWLAGPHGDPQLARELGLRLAREPGRAELELVYGSWDPPGARLLDVVTVIDRLLSPGGDPWKQAQTHQSLAGYLLEECYEAYDAIEAGDVAGLREELGDLLLQIVLHARLAENQPPQARWSIDDVAGGLVDKLIRRNPHVFGDKRAANITEVTGIWSEAKRAEKARASVLDGIAFAQPALALAAKMLARVADAGLSVPLPQLAAQVAAALSPTAPPRADTPVRPPAPAEGAVRPARQDAEGAAPPGLEGDELARLISDEQALGALLLGIVAGARARGWDAEAALRRAAFDYASAVRAAERAAR